MPSHSLGYLGHPLAATCVDPSCDTTFTLARHLPADLSVTLLLKPAQIGPGWGPMHVTSMGSATLDRPRVCRVKLSSKELLEIMRSANADQMTQALATLGACSAVQGLLTGACTHQLKRCPPWVCAQPSRGCLLLHVPTCCGAATLAACSSLPELLHASEVMSILQICLVTD